jgi:hypothetical protein
MWRLRASLSILKLAALKLLHWNAMISCHALATNRIV